MIKLIANLRFLIFYFSIFVNIIVRVKGQQSGDCAIFQDAVKELGEQNLEIIYSIMPNTTDCCSLFHMVNCVDNNITEIKFKEITCNKGLELAISKLGNLQHLTSFELRKGERCGNSMPNNLSELKNLKTLILSDCKFGTAPAENISLLSNLEILDLSLNHFFGSIPSSYGNLKKLRSLKLNNNVFSGAIPYTFGQLENLEELDLSGNWGIKGYIPKMSKIYTCNYEGTKLCKLSSTTCNKDKLPMCTKDDVKKTNEENGSPDPDAYKGDVQSFKIWWKNNSWKIPIIIVFTIIFSPIIIIVFGLFIPYLIRKLKKYLTSLLRRNHSK